jgi:hypothetical protein
MPPTPEQLASAGTEAAQQTALFCWAALPEQQEKYPDLKLIFHIPNGGTRNKAEAGHLKAQGVKPGVPDIFLPVPKLNFHGLWIEMKAKKNKTSEEQNVWISELSKRKYAVSVAYSWVQATEHLIYYLEL